MPYSVAARNDGHRKRCVEALVRLGVPQNVAADVAARLPGRTARALHEALLAASRQEEQERMET